MDKPPPYSETAPTPSAPGYGLPPLPHHIQTQYANAPIGFQTTGGRPYNQPPPPPTGHDLYHPATVVIHQQPVPIGASVHFGRNPVMTACPNCQYQGFTRVETASGCLTWLLCLALCFVGCFMGCCLIPFCMDVTKNVNHSCARCHRQLGFHHPM